MSQSNPQAKPIDQTTSGPQQTMSGLHPTTSSSQPTTSGPHPSTPGPHPTTPGPHPTTPGPHPTTPGPHPTTPGPHPTTPGPQPTTHGTHPTTPGPRPSTSGPQSTTSGSHTVSYGTSNKRKSEKILQDSHLYLKRFKEQHHEVANASIYDFAGQSVFYTTHQFFLSRRVIYLFVSNITQRLNQMVPGEDMTPLGTEKSPYLSVY
jgi:hypothetical protein